MDFAADFMADILPLCPMEPVVSNTSASSILR